MLDHHSSNDLKVAIWLLINFIIKPVLSNCVNIAAEKPQCHSKHYNTANLGCVGNEVLFFSVNRWYHYICTQLHLERSKLCFWMPKLKIVNPARTAIFNLYITTGKCAICKLYDLHTKSSRNSCTVCIFFNVCYKCKYLHLTTIFTWYLCEVDHTSVLLDSHRNELKASTPLLLLWDNVNIIIYLSEKRKATMKSKSFDFYNITRSDKSLAVRPGLPIMHTGSILTPSLCNFL